MTNENIQSTELDRPMAPVPIPEQAPAKDGMAELSGTRLGYWDTGGAGEPVVFLHPASGSALIWLYQQPVFSGAGYRVIAYSRRNYYNSEPALDENPGTGSEDLHNFIEFLGLKRFHAVSSAAGGSVAADYALSHPERLLSLTVSSNNLAAVNGYIAEAAARIKLPEWDALPRWFRELGPSYRATNPGGVAKWIELNHKSELGRGARQKLCNVVTPDVESADAADDRRSRHVHAACNHPDDSAARSGQRGRDRGGMRPFDLLGTTQFLQ
jgi:pimeloyl-ACP methyl ester carboxylesterase